MRNALTGVERALFWTLAFAAFAAAAAGLAARAVDRLAASYEQNRNAYAVVRVIAPEGPEGVTAAEAALAESPYVTSAAPMTAGRAADLLGRATGEAVRAEDLPPLRLIEVELAPAPADADIAGEIVAALAQGGVTAELVQAPDEPGQGSLAGRARAAALWGAIAFGFVMALIVSFAARGLAARRREVVTVMCDLGATRGQAAGRVADEAALLGLYAGLVGGALAGVTALVVMALVIPNLTFETLPRMILPIDLAPILAAPLGAAIAAGVGARAAASYFHGQAARLG